MGHLRLGRLPKTLQWQNVVGLLIYAADDVQAVARATSVAANSRLQQLGSDPVLAECFWLLTRLAAASRETDFVGALARIGVSGPASDSALGFVSQVTHQMRDVVAGSPESGPFGEIASLAFRRALMETVAQHGRSLFGSSVDDIQHALRSHSTADQFGDLAWRFFGDYLARTLKFFVEKELSNSVHAGAQLNTIDDSIRFSEELDVFTRQSARIMEDFAGDWFSKHNWEARGEISSEEAQAFVAVALRKLRAELRHS
jgi:hypothetical protein